MGRKELGIKKPTFFSRIRRGWGIERIMGGLERIY